MTPVFLLMDETVGHMNGKAVLPDLKDIKVYNRKNLKAIKRIINLMQQEKMSLQL